MRISSGEALVPRATTEPEPVHPEMAGPLGDSGPTFSEVMVGIGRELEKGETTTRAAIVSLGRGHDIGPAHLIALQTGVYRYSEVVDLSSRLIDRVTGGVKTVIQGAGQ